MIPGFYAAGAVMAGGPTPGGDPHWASVVSLLHFDGPNDSTTITDQIIRIWTVNGNARLRTAQRRWGPSSLYLDGNGDYLTTPDAAGLTLAGTDATIECWIRPSDIKPHMAVVNKRPASGTSEFSIYVANGYLGAFGWNSAGEVIQLTGGSQLEVDVWYHVALSVSGSTWRLFLNGALEAVGTTVGAIQGNGFSIYIGRDRINSSRDFPGYIDDFRWTAGIARYTSGFTPPTAPFPDGP